jgi:hypothetical protein
MDQRRRVALMKKSVGWVVASCLLLTSCAGNRTFSVAELQRDDAQYEKLAGKRIEAHMKNEDVRICYVTKAEADSLVVSLREDGRAPRKLAKADIRYLIALADFRTATVLTALGVCILVIIGISVNGLAEGIASMGH